MKNRDIFVENQVGDEWYFHVCAAGWSVGSASGRITGVILFF